MKKNALQSRLTKAVVLTTAVALAMAGCASSSKNITTAYVSPMQYQPYDCDQLAAEAARIQGRVSALGGRLDTAAQNDAAIMGVGLILFWPALFFIGGTKDQEAEYSRLKGEYEAVQQASIAKKCSMTPATAVAPWRLSPRSRLGTGHGRIAGGLQRGKPDRDIARTSHCSLRRLRLVPAPARLEQMQVDTSLAQRTAALRGHCWPPRSRSRTSPAVHRPIRCGCRRFPAASSSARWKRRSGLRGWPAANRQAGPYTLVADLTSLDEPFMGASLTVTVTVKYWLVERASGKTVYEKSIATPHTSAFGDAFIYSERLRLANEGAMRANISRLIEELVALKVAALELR